MRAETAGELRREWGRKAFHMLTLVYWTALALWGWPRTGWCMAVWLAIVLMIEIGRLHWPPLERALVRFFKGMMRDTERRHFSGIVHTTAGSLAAMILAGGDLAIAGAAIGQLAFADAAAALAGKAFGRVRLIGRKSLEGSLAGFAAGYAVAIFCGFRPGTALASALAASLVELMPTTPWFNDNLCLPVVSALILRGLR